MVKRCSMKTDIIVMKVYYWITVLLKKSYCVHSMYEQELEYIDADVCVY